MKKKELKKRIENGFSQLSPDVFEAVLEESSKQEVVWAEAQAEKSSVSGRNTMGRFPRYAMSLCASLAVICLCIFGVLGQRDKSVYMVIDINPSIQIEMNEAHQVKRLTGLNQDGKDVVKELRWRKRESVQELLDILIQDVVEKSYLRENGGILVTLAARDKCACESLEHTLGEGIDRKLTELKVSGVTTAFQQAPDCSERPGRKLLEAELTEHCGLDEKQVQQMSVIELIEYCQDYTCVELKLSEASEKERAARHKGGDKPGMQPPPVSGNDSGQNPEGGTSEKKESEKKKEVKEKSSKKPGDEKQVLREEQSEEGNTDNQKEESSSALVSLEDSAQTGEAIPSGPGSAAMQTGDGEPLAPGVNPGQPEDNAQTQAGNVLGQPEDGKTELKNVLAGPEGGEKQKPEDDLRQNGDLKHQEPGDDLEQAGDLKHQGTVSPEQAEEPY